MNLSIIIPTHNEEKVLENTVNEIKTYVEVPDYEILICNDNSTDKTLDIAYKLWNKYDNIRVISNKGKRGFGNILRFGIKHAKGKYICIMMADLCDNPKTVNDMYTIIKNGFVDCVVGSRYMPGGDKHNVNNKIKSFFSWFVGWYSYNFLKIKTCDTTNAFKMIKKETLNNINLISNDFDISLELTIKLWQKGYRITEIPTVWIDRTKGKSKFSILRTAMKYIRWL